MDCGKFPLIVILSQKNNRVPIFCFLRIERDPKLLSPGESKVNHLKGVRGLLWTECLNNGCWMLYGCYMDGGGTALR